MHIHPKNTDFSCVYKLSKIVICIWSPRPPRYFLQAKASPSFFVFFSMFPHRIFGRIYTKKRGFFNLRVFFQCFLTVFLEGFIPGFFTLSLLAKSGYLISYKQTKNVTSSPNPRGKNCLRFLRICVNQEGKSMPEMGTKKASHFS